MTGRPPHPRPFSARQRPSASERLRGALADPVRQFQLSLFLLLALVLVGTAGYTLLEGWPWIDSLYMTIITMTTVGFGETRPLTDIGRVFTMVVIVMGVGIGAWAASNAVEVIVGQTLWTSVQRRKMRERIARLRDHYIVCGYGKLGARIALDLAARGERFVIVDSAQELEERLLAEQLPHVIGDATADEVLVDAGIERARGLVAALSSEAENVLTVLSAREMNPRLLIVARADAESSERKLRRAGANRVVSPDAIGGHRLALAMIRPAVHDFFNEIFDVGYDVSVDVGQITIPAGSPIAGQTVAECDLRRLRNLSILAIREHGGRFVLNPGAQRVLQAGEVMIVIGPAEAVYELEAMYGEE